MKNIKQLQNNFTTPEQSKRLLELGVPADSADCVNYISGNSFGKIIVTNDALQIPNGSTFSGYACGKTYPIWSVGRLIEILELCWDSHLPACYDIHDEDDLTEYMVTTIEYYANYGMLDFSKLEE